MIPVVKNILHCFINIKLKKNKINNTILFPRNLLKDNLLELKKRIFTLILIL